jgi:AhpC/TSA family
LWFVMIFQAFLALGLLIEVRRLRSLRATSLALPIGSRAPNFSTTDARSAEKVASKVFQSHDHVMLFVSPNCQTCHDLIGGLGALDSVSPIVICRGAKTCDVFLKRLEPDVPLLLDPHGVIFDKYGAQASPTAIVVSENRIQAYGQPRTVTELKELVDSVSIQTASNASVSA